MKAEISPEESVEILKEAVRLGRNERYPSLAAFFSEWKTAILHKNCGIAAP